MTFNRNFNIFIQENVLESVVCEMAAILSRPQCVKSVKRFIMLVFQAQANISDLETRFQVIACLPRCFTTLASVIVLFLSQHTA